MAVAIPKSGDLMVLWPQNQQALGDLFAAIESIRGQQGIDRVMQMAHAFRESMREDGNYEFIERRFVKAA